MNEVANDSLASVVVATLRAHGVARALVAPGSRSTPIVAALHAADFPMHLVLDERAAAYAAVGCARAGEIAAVVTTSGTAVANLLPGLAEAERDELPVVALTADRPLPEVEARANQTVHQPPLLAGAARGRADFTAAALDDDWRERLSAALAALHAPSPGPAHLNLRFDKPLTPAATSSRALPADVHAHPAQTPPAAPWDGPVRGLVVVGALPFRARKPVSALLDSLPWPALVDVTSGIDRAHKGRYRAALLRAPAARERLRPDRVLWIGGRVTDPVVGAWLRDIDIVQWRTGDAIRDADGITSAAVTVDFGGALPDTATARPSELDLEPFAAAFPDPPNALQEPSVARLVADSLGADEVLFVGSSMPIRDVDRFATRLRAPVLANRGISGIDGNLATAYGAHVAAKRPVTALLGDLAFLHDASTLGLLAQTGADMRIVCVNNSGGGIFHFLPIAEHQTIFQPWCTAPHDLDPVAISRGFGVPARRVRSWEELETALKVLPSGPELLEVRTDREANHALHVELDRRYQGAIR